MAELRWVDWPGLQYYHSKVTDLIDTKLRDCIRFGGELAFSELPSPDTPDLNIIFRITNDFTVLPSNEWFDKNCWNQVFTAGTILQVVQTQDGIVYTVFLKPLKSTAIADMSNYYSKDEVDQLFISKLEDYASLEYVNDEIESIQTQLSTLEEELKVNISDIETQLDNNSSCILNLTTQVDSNEATLNAMSGELDTIADDIVDLRTDVDSINNHITTFEQTVVNNYITIDDGVTKDALEQEVQSQLDSTVETLIEEKVAEVVNDGVEVTSISYGEF